MSKKVSIEIKAAVLNHFLTEKCSIASLSKYAFEKYKIDVSRQAISKWVKNKLGFKINDFMIISIHLIYSRNKYEFENLFKDAILENRESFAPNIKKRSKTLKKCRLQNTDDIALENAVHDKCLYHYGQGVKINQPIVEIVASELKSNFLNSTNISRRWIEGFLDKKGYSWKKLRGSKGYTPESDLEACRQEIRLQTKNYDPLFTIPCLA